MGEWFQGGSSPPRPLTNLNQIKMEILEKQFKKTSYVGWESSMTPHIEREERVMVYNVGWDKERERGWFEMYDEESSGEDYYAEGGLCFDGNTLVDYDGVFTLSDDVVKCIKSMGGKIDI